MSNQEPITTTEITPQEVSLVVDSVLHGPPDEDSLRAFRDLQQSARIGLRDQLPETANFGYGVTDTEALVAMPGQPVEVSLAMESGGQRHPLDLTSFGLPELPDEPRTRGARPSFLTITRGANEDILGVTCFTDQIAKGGSSEPGLGLDSYELSYEPDADGVRRLVWSDKRLATRTADNVAVLLSTDDDAKSTVRAEITEVETAKPGRRTVSIGVNQKSDFDGKVVVIRPTSPEDTKITPHKVAKAERRVSRTAKARAAIAGGLMLLGLGHGAKEILDDDSKPPLPITTEYLRGGDTPAEKRVNLALTHFLNRDLRQLQEQAWAGGGEPYLQVLKLQEATDALNGAKTLDDIVNIANSAFKDKLVFHTQHDDKVVQSENFYDDVLPTDIDSSRQSIISLAWTLNDIDERLINNPIDVYLGRNTMERGTNRRIGGWASGGSLLVLDVVDSNTQDWTNHKSGHELAHIIDQSTGYAITSSVEEVEDGKDYVGPIDYQKTDVRNEDGQLAFASLYASNGPRDDTAETLAPILGYQGTANPRARASIH